MEDRPLLRAGGGPGHSQPAPFWPQEGVVVPVTEAQGQLRSSCALWWPHLVGQLPSLKPKTSLPPPRKLTL